MFRPRSSQLYQMYSTMTLWMFWTHIYFLCSRVSLGICSLRFWLWLNLCSKKLSFHSVKKLVHCLCWQPLVLMVLHTYRTSQNVTVMKCFIFLYLLSIFSFSSFTTEIVDYTFSFLLCVSQRACSLYVEWYVWFHQLRLQLHL